MHNVETGFPGLCPGKLDLSNTPITRKTLSLVKPPREESSFAAFLVVLDGIKAPGPGNGGTLQGSSSHRSALFRQFRQKRPVTGPRRPGFYLTEPASAGSFLPYRPCQGPILSGSGSFPPSRSRTMLSGEHPFPVQGPSGSGTEKDGYETTIPLREKSGEKPCI